MKYFTCLTINVSITYGLKLYFEQYSFYLIITFKKKTMLIVYKTIIPTIIIAVSKSHIAEYKVLLFSVLISIEIIIQLRLLVVRLI